MPSRSYRILGVDPGTRAAGYGLIERPRDRASEPFTYLECGVLSAPSTAAVPERIHIIASHLLELIDEFRPDALALEKAFHGRNAASALKLGQARGAIMLLASQRSLPSFEYAPAQIKQSVVGNGRATKQQIQARVQLLFSLQRPPTADAADALAIALCHGYAEPRPVLRLVREDRPGPKAKTKKAKQ